MMQVRIAACQVFIKGLCSAAMAKKKAARPAKTSPVEEVLAAVCPHCRQTLRKILVEKLGISRQALYEWRKCGVPAERVIIVEEVTGIPRSRLRPDIYPPS